MDSGIAGAIAIGVVIFATGGLVGALVSNRLTRRIVNKFQCEHMDTEKAVADLRKDIHETLSEQAGLCVEAVTQLYAERQADLTTYANALAAGTQGLNELITHLDQAEAGMPEVSAASRAHLEEVRKISRELRAILNSVTFADLERCLETLRTAQNREIEAFDNLVHRAQNHCAQPVCAVPVKP